LFSKVRFKVGFISLAFGFEIMNSVLKYQPILSKNMKPFKALFSLQNCLLLVILEYYIMFIRFDSGALYKVAFWLFEITMVGKPK